MNGTRPPAVRAPAPWRAPASRRKRLKSILAEQKLATTGIVDPQIARKLGQIIGVDAIVTGTTTPFGDTVRLSIKVLDVVSARVISGSAADIPKTKAIEELIARNVLNAPVSSAAPNSWRSTQPAPSASGAARSAQSSRAEVQTGAADGFSVALQSCRRAGSTVICRLVVTNQREDRPLYYFGNGARAFDESGQEFSVSEVIVANTRDRMVTKTVISGVPTPASVSFDGVSGSSTMFSVLEIRADNFRDSIKFRNVPIQ